MANIFESLRNWFWQPIMQGSGLDYKRIAVAEQYRNYRTGNQRRQIATKPGQHDDNLALNFTGLVIDRSVTLLFGEGVEFDLPGEDENNPAADYIAGTWNVNKKSILLHNLALLGAEQGTCYLKLMPGAITKQGQEYVRLMAIDPALVTMDTHPDDLEDVIRYVIQYVTRDLDGTEVARKQVIERSTPDDGPTVFWWVRDYISSQKTSGRWALITEESWPYSFAPMIHWQNLPDPTQAYGVPDVTDDVIEAQDKLNFVASNISKIIRLYAHPQRYGRNLGVGSQLELGPDKMPNFSGPDAEILQLDPVDDLTSSQAFMLTLRQALFDITQTVDISSMADKLGALTNFGLRVLYRDALAKLETKRSLYGEALVEVNRRLLVLGGFGDEPEAGDIIWPDILPSNEQEEVTGLTFDLDRGLVSKQTVSEKRGYNWEYEQERMVGEQATGDSVGAAIIRAFNAGQ